MPKKRNAVLSQDDIATICDVYDGIRFDFSEEEVLPLIFGKDGKQLSSVTVNGEIRWYQVNRKKLEKTINGLVSNQIIGSKWSADSLLNKLINALSVNKINRVGNVKQEVTKFLEDIYAAEPVEYEICMPVYGVSIANGTCLDIGKYSFVHADYLMKNKFPKMAGVDTLVEQSRGCHTECFVCINVSACEQEKAKELALSEFKWIENAIRFSMPNKIYGAGITSYDVKWTEWMVVAIKNSDSASFSTSLRGPLSPIKIEELVKREDFKRMIEVLANPDTQLTEMQKRVKYAIYLCGLSMQTLDLSVSYFLCVAAMEALFCKQENPYVSPSIAQQIIESFCYLLVEEDKRRQCFEDMQDLYRNRSAVAHGGEKSLTEEDVWQARMYLMFSVDMLLMDERLSKITTITGLRELVKDIKFGKHKAREMMK